MLEYAERIARAGSLGLAVLSATAILAMPLIIGYSTISRYLIGEALSVSEELSSFLLVVCVFLALPYAAMQGKHVKFALIVGKLPPRPRRILEIVTYTAAFIFMCVLTKLTYDFTMMGYMLNSHSATAHIYEAPWRAAMPVSSAWLAFVLLVFAARSLHDLVTDAPVATGEAI